MALAREGVNLVITARGKEALEATANELRQFGVRITTVAGDITTDEGRRSALAACPAPDILINNAGGPPTGDFREWDREVWMKAIVGNMLTPIELIKATVDGMIARRFGRIVNITSTSVKAPLAPLGLSNGARAGLTGFIAGLARQTVKHNVTINNLLPGSFLTDRTRQTLAGFARQAGVTEEEAKANRLKSIPAGRLGDPAEFGDACAYLCSAQASYVTGQNFLIDGGAYPGTF
jgi:3-oxoacyl-[acyl-carrier protein] reductase